MRMEKKYVDKESSLAPALTKEEKKLKRERKGGKREEGRRKRGKRV